MDDDIDIEEHDLLDNPAIKNIFPDLSVLKKEICGYFDEGSEIKNEPDIFPRNEQIDTKDQDWDTLSDTDNSYTGNKINQTVITTSERPQTPLIGNKIILGSKPTQHIQSKVIDKYHEKLSYAAKIYLNDIGPYLTNSERFCKECLTIFPQKRAFDIHKKKVHNHNRMCNRIKTNNRITIGAIIKKHKCNECSASFSQQSLLRRHMINAHKRKLKRNFLNTKPTSLHLSSSARTKTVKSSKFGHQCFHCNASFSSKKLVIEHMYKVLQSKKGMLKPEAKHSGVNKSVHCIRHTNKRSKRVICKVRNIDSNQRVQINMANKQNVSLRLKTSKSLEKDVKKLQESIFQCVYCSYIFSHKKFCMKHIVNKHKDSSITELKAVEFNEQCKYCLKKNDNWKLHNAHMQMCHKQKIEKTFKINPKICLTKVDHIMQKQQTLEQVDEQEMEVDLSESPDVEEDIKEEESKQVFDDDQLLLKSVLFKCKRCDIHFLSAESAMKHAEHMELLINWKCLLCNKIFKKVDEQLHQKQHLFSSNFRVYELSESQLALILYKCAKCAIHFNANGYLPHFRKCEVAVAESFYCKVCDILIDSCISGSHENNHNKKKLKPKDFTIINSDAIRAESIQRALMNPVQKMQKKRNRGLQLCLKLSYCKTCNSFISKRGNHMVHMESRCSHLPTYICHICGLTFTNKTMGTHRAIHKQKKSLKLQDFLFYNIRTHKQIMPPLPEFKKCNGCHVHFISKAALINHVCSEDFLTCHICNIKLSEPVFKLHMSFHYYSKTKKGDNYLNEADEKEEKDTARPTPRIRELTVEPHMNLEADGEPTVNNENAQQVPEKAKTDESKNVNVDNTTKECAVSELVTDKDMSISTNKTNSLQTCKITDNLNKPGKSDYLLYNILYCCVNCRTTIDSYDAVVEHCQEHLCGVEIQKIGCETCKLQLDPKSYKTHTEFHTIEPANRSFKILEFDTFYFTLEDSLWIKHIFQNLDKEKSRQILDRSIYKYSAKMKMQVIQDGPPDLTVYKCNSCLVIVDPDTLLKHVENSCFKTRKHPCSHCGLPFMSYISLKKHLYVHKKIKISLKSYRIVVINQEKDKKLNRIINGPNKQFLFYKCRKCNGVIDTYQRQNHEALCNDEDLKKCNVCDLLFYSADYKSHQHKHKVVCNFVPKNMKIILFGQCPTNVDVNPIQQTTFDGTVVDFTFIQCVKCRVCLEKSPTTLFKHQTCYEDSLITKCTKCELYILKSKMARHSKLHDINVHFVKDNINVLHYDHSLQLSKFIPADINRLNGQEYDKSKVSPDKNVAINTSISATNQASNFAEPYTVDKISERATKLYKCSCGLHFVDKSSILEHLDNCNSKASRQHCSKCNLMFTPAVLFSHLLQHHGDKKYIYKFNIIEMSSKKKTIVVVYNCTNCKTHFLDYDKAMIHFENCEGFAQRLECTKCKMFFSNCSITQHENLHHGKNIADVEIVDITKKIVNEIIEETEARSIDNVIEPVDFVRESKFNISDDNLSQIDLSRYSNTIFRCDTCNTHFLTEHTYKRHFSNEQHFLSPQDTCNICELSFSLQSLTKHIYIHHKKMKLNKAELLIKSNLIKKSDS